MIAEPAGENQLKWYEFGRGWYRAYSGHPIRMRNTGPSCLMSEGFFNGQDSPMLKLDLLSHAKLHTCDDFYAGTDSK